MNFFFAADREEADGRKSRSKLTLETAERMGCKACPLDKLKDLKHPKMDATGSKTPVVYMLGEGPGYDEDRQGIQFVGESGQLLRGVIPSAYESRLRWNNSINCHKPKNETPASLELSCCRSRIVSDIERTKPKAIFGFGGVALKWAVGEDGITKWRGFRVPVKIGDHSCWFYPMLHPAYLLRRRRKGRGGRTLPSEEEKTFRRDLRRAFNESKKLLPPKIPNEDDIYDGVSFVTGEEGWADVRKIREQLAYFGKKKLVAFDYETASDERDKRRQTRPYGKNARILTTAVSDGKTTFSFPLYHREAKWTKEQLKAVIKAWVNFLSSPALKIAHNLFFELEWSVFFFGKDKARCSRWADTMAQAYVLQARQGMQSLDTLTLMCFGFNLKGVSKVNRSMLDHEPIERVLSYNALDAKWTCNLYIQQRKRLKKEGLLNIYEDQVRRIPTVVLKSYFGMLIDFKQVIAFDKTYTASIIKLREWFEKSKTAERFRNKFGKKFNPSSPKDVLAVFRDILNRRECKIEDKDNPGKFKLSTEDEVLEKIPLKFAKKMREYRAATGNKSKYIDPLIPAIYYRPRYASKPNEVGKCIWPDGKTHAVIQTLFLVTRRTSCSFPNEQFWPKRDERYRDLRREFVAPTANVLEELRRIAPQLSCEVDPDDCWFVTIDHGQIEARVVGAASNDRVYCTYIWDRNDLHMDWTKKLAYAYPQRIGGKKFLKDKDVLKQFRTDVKNQWTFPLIYRATPPSVARYLNMPVSVIEPLIYEFFDEMPGLEKWQDKMISFYNEHGYVETMTGWRRHEPMKVNEVVNTPIQGSASDITVNAMCDLSEAAQELDRWQFQARLEVHDELGFWIPKKTFDRDIEFIADYMLECKKYPWLNVPLCIEVSKGPNWYDVGEVATLYSDDFGKIDRKECGF